MTSRQIRRRALKVQRVLAGDVVATGQGCAAIGGHRLSSLEEQAGDLPATKTFQSPPMQWWERLGSIVLGLATGGAGGYAVFATSNQAGSAALILAGAAFLLIGLQGTRLVKLGGGGSSIEMARYEAAAQVMERAEREKDPEKAEGMVEAAAMISPTVVRSPQAEARRYEDELHRALERTGAMVRREVVWDPTNRPVDFVVETGDGRRALIEAKPRRYGTLTGVDVQDAMNQVNAIAVGVGDAGLLIITNAPLSGDVQEFNAKPEVTVRPVEVISWNDERDDGILARALMRVAR